jgi:DNA-binding LacI/PurR family transcriptional regulator
MAKSNDVDIKTLRRAFRVLQKEGLLSVEPRKGYRVLSRPAVSATSGPVAYLLHNPSPPADWDTVHDRFASEFRAAVGKSGRSLLAVSSRDKPVRAVLDELLAARVSGALLDTLDEKLIKAIQQVGIPSVLVDAWIEDAGTDVVMQDGHLGGLQAVRYLADRGHRRIGWFGPVDSNMHTLDRLGGTLAGLAAAGLSIEPRDLFKSSFEARAEKAREIVASPDRPPALICLWQEFLEDLKQAADAAGLVIGRDLEVVAWSPEELYEPLTHRLFPGQPVPAVVTWSIRSLASAAVDRIEQRRLNPAMPALRMKIPTRLRLPSDVK